MARPSKEADLIWLDNIKEDRSYLETTLHEATQLVEDRGQWRHTVHNMDCQRATAL